jgi:hypothetical protein
VSEVEVICGDVPVQSSCRCGLAPRHDGDHVCAENACGAVWTYDGEEFVPLTWPGGFGQDGAYVLGAELWWPQ